MCVVANALVGHRSLPSFRSNHFVSTGSAQPLIIYGYYFCIMQELIVIDDLLSALVGIEGRYVSIRRVHGKDDTASFQIDASMDLALQVRTLLHCFSFSNGISILHNCTSGFRRRLVLMSCTWDFVDLIVSYCL